MLRAKNAALKPTGLTLAQYVALTELERVFGDPADGSVSEAGGFGVLPGAFDDTAGGVDVHNLGAGGRGGERAAACVGEEVEDAGPIVALY